MPMSFNQGQWDGKQNGYLEMTQDVFQSYSGADIQAAITLRTRSGVQTKTVGTLSSITVATVREVFPLYVMGRQDYVSVSKGKRSISGTMVFTVFDRDPLVRDLLAGGDGHWAELQSQYDAIRNDLIKTGSILDPSSIDSTKAARALYTVSQSIRATKALHGLIAQQPIRYADQMAPFDVTISLANDQGSASVWSVRQCTIVSQGSGNSMHEMESDMVFQYIARYYDPMTSIITMNGGSRGFGL